jgi:acyl-CoA synthetase (AMP-forming)/AMP-acid ligase II
MPNTAWWPVIALGIWRAGTALVPLGPRWTLEEAQRALARVRPAMAIPSESLVPLARDALRAAEVGAELVTDGSARSATPLERLLAAAAGDAFAEPGLAPGDLA